LTWPVRSETSQVAAVTNRLFAKASSPPANRPGQRQGSLRDQGQHFLHALLGSSFNCWRHHCPERLVTWPVPQPTFQQRRLPVCGTPSFSMA